MFDLIARSAQGSLLSPYWIQFHQSEGDYERITQWQPPTLRLLEQSWANKSDGPLYRLAQALPNTLFTLRDTPLSHEFDRVWAEPYSMGVEHAERCLDQFPTDVPGLDLGRVMFPGLNEPKIGFDTPDGIVLDEDLAVRLAAYEIARLQTLNRYGARGLALNFSRGWPPNTGRDTRVNWTPFEGVHTELRNGKGNALGVHEYWFPDPTGFVEGWIVNRVGQCPWDDVEIIVGECGVSTGAPDHVSWRVLGITPEKYASQFFRYERLMRRDPRVVSLEIFAYDADHAFDTYDIRGQVSALIVADVQARRDEPRPEPVAIPNYPPNVVNPLPPSGDPDPDPDPDPTDPPEDALIIGEGFRKALADAGDEAMMSEAWGAPHGGSMLIGRNNLYFWHPDAGVAVVKREA